MPNKDTKILKYNNAEKSMRVLLIIYGDVKPLLEKIGTCYTNS